MREKEQTSIHLLLASIVTMFGTILILTIVALSWELWMVPVILIGNTLIWCLHIGRAGSESFYVNLCAGLLMVGFFFFGVHSVTLFDIPAVACMMILVYSMFDKKRLLYMTAALYVLVLLYHFFILHTITSDMGTQNMIRMGLGITVVVGSMLISRFRINRRLESRAIYDNTLAELKKSERQNAEFLSNVSHEIRTPINMVLGISEVILEKNISPDIRADMQSIKLAGKRLSNQIVNMLDYTEIMEGTLIPTKEPYRIISVLNDLITMTAMQSGKQHLEMVFDLDPKIPAVLIGDVEKISHVLKIIVENSIKFTEEGGINVYIHFRQESYGVNLMIDIYDTGIGMTDSQLTQMCDDFYQADSGSSRFAGGLGLGLPIARGLLHAMGGFIHFSSSEQQGLQVHITIPQGVEKDTPAMIVTDPKQLCIACYFRPEKYNSDEVKRYYDKMIYHMMEGLNLDGYQAHNFEGLVKLLNTRPLTHVFIAQTEYEENHSYYEDLANKLQVVIIADRDFTLSRHSKLLVIRKPFFALSVVNLLNGEVEENGFGEAQAAGRKPFSCDKVRVLAVDDEEMNLVVAKGVLGSYNIQVDTCLSGREAVERCSTTDYDIIFLDHMMPGFDGVETMRQIRTIQDGKYKDLPIIALTANTISGAREMFRNEGFTEFIPKPIERPVLERVLRKVLPEDQVQYEEMPVTPEEAPLPDHAGSPKPSAQTEPEAKNYIRKKGSSKKSARKKGSPMNIFSKRGRSQQRVSEVDIPKATAPEYDLPETGQTNDNVSKRGRSQQRIMEIDIPRATAPEYELPETPIPNDPIPKDRISKGSILKYRIPVYSIPRGRDFKDSVGRYRKTERDLPEDTLTEYGSADHNDPQKGGYTDPDGLSEGPANNDPADQNIWDADLKEGAYTDFDESQEPDEDDLTDYDAPDVAPEEDGLWDDDTPDDSSGLSLSADASQPFAPLSRVGINVQLGLDYCCGEDGFYMEMLDMFYTQAEKKKSEIVALYDAADWDEYTVKVHALKSTSMTIGAEGLAEQARLLEQAGKTKDIDFIRRNHDALLRLYDEICKTIAEL